MEELSSALPEQPALWLQTILNDDLPVETESICDPCVMCASDVESISGAELTFRPDAKCCTYHPDLPNFLAGRILDADDDDEGRRRLLERIEVGDDVDPRGVFRPDSYRRGYRRLTERDEFGRRVDLVCPYLDSAHGLCTIWAHRESVCSTWFCKHRRGAVGLGLWRAVRHLLYTAEQELVRWCIVEADLGARAVEALFPVPGTAEFEQEQATSVEDRARQWGRFAGREVEFYVEAARRVDVLSWSEVRQIGGPMLTICEDKLRHAHRRYRDLGLPERLMHKEFERYELDDDMVRVASYSPYDPVDIPKALVSALSCFDGRRVRDAIEAAKLDHQLVLDLELVRQLMDFELLVEV